MGLGLGVVNLLTGVINLLGAPAPPVNALGYHSVQNYLYAVDYNSRPQNVIRIGAGGTAEVFAEASIAATVTNNQPLLIGDIDGNQQYWLGHSAGLGYVKLDLNAESETYGTVVASGAPAAALPYPIGDWAYIPAYPDALFALGQEIVPAGTLVLLPSYNTHLMLFNTTTFTWANVATFAGISGGVTGVLGEAQWGSVYSANDGNVYGTEQNSGLLWRFPIAGGNAALVSLGAIPLNGDAIDGARCPLSDSLVATLL